MKDVFPESESRAFDRLHALVRKGYRPELGTDSAGGAIRLTHVAAATPDLILHESGLIEPVVDRVPRHKRRLPERPAIAAQSDADQVEFLRFIDRVPRPTLRDRTRRWRTKWVYGPLFVATTGGLGLLFTAIIADGF